MLQGAGRRNSDSQGLEEALVRAGRPDWRGELEYPTEMRLTTDTQIGKLYVGSAYGEQGVRSRWAVIHSPGATVTAWPTTVTRSRCPRARVLSTRKPFSPLWNVTRARPPRLGPCGPAPPALGR